MQIIDHATGSRELVYPNGFCYGAQVTLFDAFSVGMPTPRLGPSDEDFDRQWVPVVVRDRRPARAAVLVDAMASWLSVERIEIPDDEVQAMIR